MKSLTQKQEFGTNNQVSRWFWKYSLHFLQNECHNPLSKDGLGWEFTLKTGVDFVTWLGSDWAGADLADVEAAGGECCWLRSFVLKK